MKALKHLLYSLSVLCFVMSTLGGTVLAAQSESKPSKPRFSEEDQKLMDIWQEYVTRNENHKYLEYFVGKWEAATKTWMKPGAKPMSSKNYVEGKMVLDKRYLRLYMKGIMMGMPFEALVFTGYDNFNKKFVSVWLENMTTGFFEVSGTLDKTGKTRTENALWDDIITGKKMKVRIVTKIIHQDNFSLEIFSIPPNHNVEFKSLEMIYTRIK